jgi:hypothetical protein
MKQTDPADYRNIGAFRHSGMYQRNHNFGNAEVIFYPTQRAPIFGIHAAATDIFR